MNTKTEVDMDGRKHTCQYCQKKSFMIIYNHEKFCEKNPNQQANITKRYGANHVSGAQIWQSQTQAQLASGLARPLPVSTPLALAAIGAQAVAGSSLPNLSFQDVSKEFNNSKK
jgi:hypothetical protein